jgi:uncharacterized peroxidase-related enzyme
VRARHFTLESVEWRAWMPPVDAATATPEQRAALDASPQATSAYFRTLAHDVAALAERSPLFHSVMYVSRGLKRADRELASVVVSVINGCVYCSSVHARRFVELSKQPGSSARCSTRGWMHRCRRDNARLSTTPRNLRGCPRR